MSANLKPNPPAITINQPEGIYWQPDIQLTDPVADALADIYSFLLQRAAQRKRQEALQLADTATVAEGIEVEKMFAAEDNQKPIELDTVDGLHLDFARNSPYRLSFLAYAMCRISGENCGKS